MIAPALLNQVLTDGEMADIARWRLQGHSEENISRWIRNGRKGYTELRQIVAGIQAAGCRVRGVAPGTPIDAAPVVVEAGSAVCETCGGLGILISTGGNPKPCSACEDGKTRQAKAVNSLAKYSSASAASRAIRQTFATYRVNANNVDARDAAQVFADRPAGWLVMHGATGNGKSHLCAAIYNVITSAGGQVVYVSAPDLLASLKALFDEDQRQEEGQTFEQRIQVYMQAPVLIIDDLGAERRTEWSDEQWFRILDYRTRNESPTVISTNHDPFKTVFEPRVASRLRNMRDGFCVVVENRDSDRRTEL